MYIDVKTVGYMLDVFVVSYSFALLLFYVGPSEPVRAQCTSVAFILGVIHVCTNPILCMHCMTTCMLEFQA